MSEVLPRISGTEMEWSLAARNTNQGEFQQLYSVDPILDQYLLQGLTRAPGGFLSNGGRFYQDVGNHIEYATPEDTSFAGTVANEIAGERIVMQSLANYIAGTDDFDAAVVLKRVIDSYGTTWGYHMNLSADRSAIPSVDDSTVHLLALHLATSHAFLGGGAVTTDSAGQQMYSLGQKSNGLTRDYCYGTTGNAKAIINQRDEDHATDQNLQRIHITSTDPHISPWASHMSLGTSSLVLRAIEQGIGKNLRIANNGHETPILTLSNLTANDLSFSKTTLLDTGHSVTPLDLQEQLLSIVAKTEHTDEEAIILKEWERAINDLQEDPNLLKDRSDAIAKLGLIHAYAERNNLNTETIFQNPVIALIDRKYTTLLEIDKTQSQKSVDDARSLHATSMAARLRKTDTLRKWVDEKRIDQAVQLPPLTTRAYCRGNAIATGEVEFADWQTYKRKNHTAQQIFDPYTPELLVT